MRIEVSSGKSISRRCAICSGLHARAHRRDCLRPWRRPFHGTCGPAIVLPPGVAMLPASRSWTYLRSAGFVTSLTGFGLLAERSACHCAVIARYSKPPPRVAALRRNSREIVEAARPSCRAIPRTPSPRARANAICSRSANDRYRPVGAAADGARCDGGIPPHCRNHLVPTACDTPASWAASSLEHPAAIAFQNGRRSDRCNTGGRPGDRIFARLLDPPSASWPPSTPPIKTCCDDGLNSPYDPAPANASTPAATRGEARAHADLAILDVVAVQFVHCASDEVGFGPGSGTAG